MNPYEQTGYFYYTYGWWVTPVFFFKTFSVAHCTCLSSWRPLLNFTSSPQGHLLTQYNPAVTPSCRMEYSLPFQFVVLFHFPVFVLYTHKSQLWGGSQHNNEPRRYLCFNWLCRRSSLDGSQNNSFTWSSSHTHVFYLLYFGKSTERSHSSLLDVLQMFSCSFKGGEFVCNSQCHLNISHMNNSNKGYYSCGG